MKSIFLVSLSFYLCKYRTKAQLDACFANSHAARTFCGDFFCLRLNNQIRISFAIRCSSRVIASRRRSCKPRWSRRLKRYFSFVAVHVYVYMCVYGTKKRTIYRTYKKFCEETKLVHSLIATMIMALSETHARTHCVSKPECVHREL